MSDSSPPRPPASADDRTPNDPEASARLRQTFLKVMTMQVAALLVLWWLQARYNG